MDFFVLDKILLNKLLNFGVIEGIPIGFISLISILAIGYSKYLDAKNKKKVHR